MAAGFPTKFATRLSTSLIGGRKEQRLLQPDCFNGWVSAEESFTNGDSGRALKTSITARFRVHTGSQIGNDKLSLRHIQTMFEMATAGLPTYSSISVRCASARARSIGYCLKLTYYGTGTARYRAKAPALFSRSDLMRTGTSISVISTSAARSTSFAACWMAAAAPFSCGIFKAACRRDPSRSFSNEHLKSIRETTPGLYLTMGRSSLRVTSRSIYVYLA